MRGELGRDDPPCGSGCGAAIGLGEHEDAGARGEPCRIEVDSVAVDDVELVTVGGSGAVEHGPVLVVDDGLLLAEDEGLDERVAAAHLLLVDEPAEVAGAGH